MLRANFPGAGLSSAGIAEFEEALGAAARELAGRSPECRDVLTQLGLWKL